MSKAQWCVDVQRVYNIFSTFHLDVVCLLGMLVLCVFFMILRIKIKFRDSRIQLKKEQKNGIYGGNHGP